MRCGFVARWDGMGYNKKGKKKGGEAFGGGECTRTRTKGTASRVGGVGWRWSETRALGWGLGGGWVGVRPRKNGGVNGAKRRTVLGSL